MNAVFCAAALALLSATDGGPSDLASQLKVSTSVQPGQVRLGEPFVYELRFEHPKDVRLDLLQPKALGNFEIFDHKRNRDDGADQATTVFQVRMALFALGVQRLPEITFEVVGTAGTTQFVAPPPTIEGISSLPPDAQQNGAQLHDIKPLRDVPVRSYRLLYALLALALLAAAAWFAWRYYKNRKLNPPVVFTPPKPLHVRTKSALDALAAENLPQQGRVREFYFRLSEILRGYLGERYRFEALECTTPELLERVDRLAAPELPRDGLRQFTIDSDLARYARAELPADTCHSSLQFAYALLEKTTPSLQPPAEPDAANVRSAVQ